MCIIKDRYDKCIDAYLGVIGDFNGRHANDITIEYDIQRMNDIERQLKELAFMFGKVVDRVIENVIKNPAEYDDKVGTNVRLEREVKEKALEYVKEKSMTLAELVNEALKEKLNK